MKILKPFSLSVLIALTAMTFFSSASAMAESTTLCGADEEECAIPNTQVHESTLSGNKAKLLSSSLNVECDVLGSGEILYSWGFGFIHFIFKWGNCNSNCTITEENGPSEIILEREGHELASVSAAGLMHVNCGGFINCRYVFEGIVGHALGPLLSSETNGSMSVSEQTLERESGVLCPSTTKLDITTTPLEATYITS